jgi:class 3 adenylate cyclase
MTQLSTRARAGLPDSSFAYIDSKGQRRLPIHDEAHVRNALARFTRVSFEDEAARERARKKLLTAAKKYGIVPIGFITAQLRAERRNGEVDGRNGHARSLPTGHVTFLLTDIEDSTGLTRRLGERYGPLLTQVRRIIRAAVRDERGQEVDSRADEYFGVFERPAPALRAALAIQRRLTRHAWPNRARVRVRIGIHSGDPTQSDGGYVGMAVHTAARITAAAHGGQILLSGAAQQAIDGSQPDGVGWRSLGRHRLRGLPDPEPLFQVEGPDLAADFPPPRTAGASFAHLTPRDT